jgi:uncharacterized protein YqfA (UPF0365 family)
MQSHLASILAQGGGVNWAFLFPLIVAGVFLLIIFLMLVQFFGIWLQAKMARAEVGFIEVIAMRVRKVDIREVILSHISLHQAGICVGVDKLRDHYLAGGRVALTSRVLMIAKKLEIPVTWEKAAALDLQGEEYVRAILPPDKQP